MPAWEKREINDVITLYQKIKIRIILKTMEEENICFVLACLHSFWLIHVLVRVHSSTGL